MLYRSAVATRRLFWVETEDHDEDWFVVAGSAGEAAEFFEEFEGYDPGEAEAREVVALPAGRDEDVGWPSDELLKLCGAQFMSSAPRVVLLNGETFVEGALEFAIRQGDDDAAEADLRGRPNLTLKLD